MSVVHISFLYIYIVFIHIAMLIYIHHSRIYIIYRIFGGNPSNSQHSQQQISKKNLYISHTSWFRLVPYWRLTLLAYLKSLSLGPHMCARHIDTFSHFRSTWYHILILIEINIYRDRKKKLHIEKILFCC